jgi:PEGA domain-containing protein
MNSPNLSTFIPSPGLASWYTPGRSDGFGDRLLMFDNSDAVSLELLRFRRDLAVAPGFDNALREGVERLARFRHAAFPEIRAVVYLDEHDLTLVSAHLPGQRLSELSTGKLHKGLHPAIVTWIIREVTPALAALHSSGPAAVHGALSPDRIVFTPEGHLCIVEHALGSALQRLGLSPSTLWREFGLLTRADERGLARIDARNDVVQMGTVALSMLLGRALTLLDFERNLPALLDEFSAMAAASPSAFAAPLRVWLEHALQLSPHSYRSAADAQEGLKELPASPFSPSAIAVPTAGYLEELAGEIPAREGEMTKKRSTTRMEVARPLRPQQIDQVTNRWNMPGVIGDTRDGVDRVEQTITSASEPDAATDRSRRRRFSTAWIAVALGLVALAEGGVILRLGTQKPVVAEPAIVIESPEPGDTVLVDGKPAGTTPLQMTVSSRTRAIRLVRAAATSPAVDAVATVPVEPAGDSRTLAAIEQATTRQRSGGVRVSSPIELKVLEGDQVLGSTADGPIVTTAGTHQLDLLNTALGYRVRQTVTIKAGVLTPLTITPPMGRISVNADPWAQVLIDDKPIGDTPLANVSVSLGEHQVVFRHPQLGERRETVIVRADAPSRVSASFQR